MALTFGWGTSIDDSMKDEIRVTVVATGVRPDKADQVSGIRRQASSYTQPRAQQQAPSSNSAQPNFERRQNFDFDLNESPEMPAAEPQQTQSSSEPQQSALAIGIFVVKILIVQPKVKLIVN